MLLIGLTGSIGMGKSTTAQMFRDEGVAVSDSDELVHEIYSSPASTAIENRFPGTVVNGVVDRERLAKHVLGDPDALKDLEEIIHPLVRDARAKFIETCRRKGEKFVVLDIPLLFETGGDLEVDVIVVVSAAADVQRKRVLARFNMTEEKFAKLLAKQMPDAEKRRRADFIVHTDRGFDFAHDEVRAILKSLESRVSAQSGDSPSHA